jgi:transcription elongation factor GreB
LLDEQDIEKRFRLVGPDELDHDPRYISVDAPLGKALLKKEEGDEVTIRVDGNEKVYRLERIEYFAIPI